MHLSFNLLLWIALFILSRTRDDSQADEWQAYKLHHGKQYADPVEDRVRFANFLSSKRLIEHHNGNTEAAYRMELNKMSDFYFEEYERRKGLHLSRNSFFDEGPLVSESELAHYLGDLLGIEPSQLLLGDQVPDSLDWRSVENRVGPVGDQGDCGSCWAFGTVGVLEGQQVVRNFSKSLEPLSVQQLLDCSHLDGGCDGGGTELALQDVHQMGGIESASDYPYRAKDLTKCLADPKKFVMTAANYKQLIRNETVLKQVVANYGPVSVGFNAIDSLRHYKEGIFSDKECVDYIRDHVVLVVGYGTDKASGRDYWIVVSSSSQNFCSLLNDMN